MAVMKYSPDIQEAVRKTDLAVQENTRALRELLECLGATAKTRISMFIEKAGDDGKGNTGRV